MVGIRPAPRGDPAVRGMDPLSVRIRQNRAQGQPLESLEGLYHQIPAAKLASRS